MSEPLPAFTDLAELEGHIGDCHRCALGDTRSRLVFGVGNPHADVMFIGEAPGRQEDLQGEPFVGAAGKLLDELLASAGLARSDVYIANILKCRPPNNRDPLPDEIATCTPFLREQIRIIDPRVIVALGKFATQFLLKTDIGITRLRGRRHEVDGRAVLPIFHPAAALYDQTKLQVLSDDFKRLAVLLEQELARAEDGAASVVAGLGPRDESAGEGRCDSASADSLDVPSPGSGETPETARPEQGTLF